MDLADPTGITLKGELGETLARSLRHLQRLNSEEMWREFDDPDEIWHWGADYPARWIATMSLLGQHTGEDYRVKEAADRLIGYQQPDGSFGAYSSPYDYKEWFGMGRGLLGLLEYYRATGDTSALEAARRLGDYYVSHYPRFTPYMYECYSNALEGVVLLARLIDDPRYLQLAREMAETSMVYQRVWQSAALSPQGRRAPCGGQVHCQLMAARGLLDLAESSGDMRYVAPVLELHHHICDRTLSIAGGVGFYFNRPEENEACADADWLRLNLQLWRMTGDLTYLELAEQTLTNQIPFSQAANGAFCYMRGLQNRSGNAFDVCCSHHVPRAIWEVLRYACTNDDGLVSVNLHLEGSFELKVDGSHFAISSECGREGNELIWRYRVRQAPVRPIAFNVRVPVWAGHGEIFVNDEPLGLVQGVGYLSAPRAWNSGDVIDVRLPQLPVVIVGHRQGRQILRTDEAAVLFGPRVFALSDLHNPTIDIHTVRISADGRGDAALEICNANCLRASGVTIDGVQTEMIFSPISETGGNPNGIGRSHPALAAPFRTWIGIEETDSGR
jgi:DUF1680 family protein